MEDRGGVKDPLICIRCPLGCFLEVDHDGRHILLVTGNRCKKGLEYAEKEIFHPERIVTTTVRLDGAEFPLLPVKTGGAVPRDLAFRVIEAASRLSVRAPVSVGQVLLADVAGSGVDLVACRGAAAVRSAAAVGGGAAAGGAPPAGEPAAAGAAGRRGRRGRKGGAERPARSREARPGSPPAPQGSILAAFRLKRARRKTRGG